MDSEMLSAEEFFEEYGGVHHIDTSRSTLEQKLEEAKEGDAEAQAWVGQHYYEQGKDRSARKWLSRAAAQGHQEARECLSQLDGEIKQGKGV